MESDDVLYTPLYCDAMCSLLVSRIHTLEFKSQLLACFTCLFCHDCLIVVYCLHTILQKSSCCSSIFTTMEPGTAKAYLPYVYDIELLCWVWRKWKLILITVVDWMASWRLCSDIYHSHSPGGFPLILIHRTMTCDFVAHRASQICGMVVTAILFVVPSCLPWLYTVFHKHDLLQFIVSISVIPETSELIRSYLIGQSLTNFWYCVETTSCNQLCILALIVLSCKRNSNKVIDID